MIKMMNYKQISWLFYKHYDFSVSSQQQNITIIFALSSKMFLKNGQVCLNFITLCCVLMGVALFKNWQKKSKHTQWIGHVLVQKLD